MKNRVDFKKWNQIFKNHFTLNWISASSDFMKNLQTNKKILKYKHYPPIFRIALKSDSSTPEKHVWSGHCFCSVEYWRGRSKEVPYPVTGLPHNQKIFEIIHSFTDNGREEKRQSVLGEKGHPLSQGQNNSGIKCYVNHDEIVGHAGWPAAFLLLPFTAVSCGGSSRPPRASRKMIWLKGSCLLNRKMRP